MDKENQVWYSTAVEKMGVFRYNIFQLVHGAKYTDDNDIVHLIITKNRFKKMMKELEKAEEFFSGKKK